MQSYKVRVLTAQGHGPNSLFPHEQAWCELWLGDNASTKAMTQAAQTKAPLMWNEVCELKSPRTEEVQQTLTVHIMGKLPAHEGVDEIGTGTCQVNLTSSKEGKHELTVPLKSPLGKDAGFVKLEIEM